jgi:hypothetical protein
LILNRTRQEANAIGPGHLVLGLPLFLHPWHLSRCRQLHFQRLPNLPAAQGILPILQPPYPLDPNLHLNRPSLIMLPPLDKTIPVAIRGELPTILDQLFSNGHWEIIPTDLKGEGSVHSTQGGF